MERTQPAQQLPDRIRDQLDNLTARVSGNSPALRIWSELTTEGDRRRLQTEVKKQPRIAAIDKAKLGKVPKIEDELKEGRPGRVLYRCFHRWGAVGIWMRLKMMPQTEAIIDLAYELGVLSDPMRLRLLKALDAKPPVKPRSKVPVWDRGKKALRFEGAVVRRIQSLSVAANVVQILDAFEGRRWRRIRNPLSRRPYDAVLSLNRGLKSIRFFVCDDGASIDWKRHRPSSDRRVSSMRPKHSGR
jgi:hypothetical protein